MMDGSLASSIGYRKAQTSATLAAQATSSPMASVNWTRSEKYGGWFPWPETSGDSSRRVPGFLFSRIYVSLRTQNGPKQPDPDPIPALCLPQLNPLLSVKRFYRSDSDALRAVLQRGQAEQGLPDRSRCLETRPAQRARGRCRTQAGQARPAAAARQ